MKNIITVDLEDYYCCNLGQNDVTNHKTSTVVKNTEKLLNLFDSHHVKATFFVLGTVAEEHPELIKKISDAGHEIASHGYGHQLIYKQSKEEFRADIRKAKKITEKIINKKVIGYRAPSWSITDESKWALNILEEEGFKYSSSIFPIHTFLYGIAGAPKVPNHPIVNNKKLKLWEIPPSSYKFLVKELGFSGGFYFRFFPWFVIKHIIKSKNKKGIPVVCYIHPWEIDKDTPALPLKGLDKFIHYYGIKRCYKKLDKLLASFEFSNIDNVILKSVKKSN